MSQFSEALEAIIKDSGLLVDKTSRSWILNCPKCSRPKLYFLKDKPKFVCWRCADVHGFRGRPEHALAEVTGETLDALRQKLYGTDTPHVGQLDLSWGEEDDFEEDGEVVQEITPFFWPHNFHPIEHEWSKKGAAYLEGRGIPLDIAVQYGIRYCPGKQAVVFPIQVGQYLLGWQERVVIPTKYIVDGETIEIPKNHNPPGMPRGELIGFTDKIVGDWVVFCEGPITAAKAHKCGGNIWTGGSNWSDQQIQLLKNHGVRKIYNALDPDAYQSSNRLIRTWYNDFEFYNMVPSKGDLGDLDFDTVRQMFDSAERIERHFRYSYFA